MAHDEVARIIEEGAGTQFDPAVVAAFARVRDEFDAVRRRLQPAAPEQSAAA